MAADAGASTFGPGCAAIPTDGAGSFDGMATAPVATAASANPLLKTLVAAVTEAGLVDTLNSRRGHHRLRARPTTPSRKIPKKDLNAVLADKATLTKILTHHVVAGSSPRRARRRRTRPCRRHAHRRGLGRGLHRRRGQRQRRSAATSRPRTPRSTSSTRVLMPTDRDGRLLTERQRKDHPRGPASVRACRRPPASRGAGRPPGRRPGRPARSARRRGDEAAFAQLYDATSARVYGLARAGGPRPGPGRGGHPGGLPRDLADRRPGSTRPGAARSRGCSRSSTARRSTGSGRPRRPAAATRRTTSSNQPVDARLDRRGRPGLARGPPGPRRRWAP